MLGDLDLDAEFSAIMAASRSRPVPHHPVHAILPSTSGVNDNGFLTLPGGGYGPSRIRPRNETVSPQPSIQVKYDTIVKGFKVLEASYEESQRKLTVTEERLSTVDATHAVLITEMEASRQVLHDRETEISRLCEDVETSKTALHDCKIEIETIRKELEESKVALVESEERIRAIRTELEEILACGICHCVATQAFSDPNGTIEPFDADRFTMLMVEIKAEAEANRDREAQAVMVVDYPFIEGGGTAINPLDLTGIWH
ncbi:hypothetical protein BDM02DRAFT_3191010 [Thelephora ganbajun]|uniref:Uncharacterized protein n=1 Tax=Thelephora ganbajun TaxID=370292 RepID=A0ACB6Z3N0_THEGA|nr:hypothetical protein BDM02DRAFT_3191010 [Thelephora ganbajun]